MAAPQKRTRAAFEADLQAQQSPYVFYGTPLPPLDPKVRDDGSYVPVWKQEVTDERGRKRLHGAFTGGFSAGYFNTVGSKDGWAPASFVSSRSNRHSAAPMKAEDFMDEEDLREAEEARQVQTAEHFSGVGSTADEVAGREPVMDLLRAAGESIGIKLLKKMGWREGQGIGPRVRRKARNDDGTEDEEMHLFAPDDSPLIAIVRKTDKKGLGFSGTEKLAASTKDNDEDEDNCMFARVTTKPKKKPATAKGGIGMGILNDNGSDDEDPYAIGPRLSYNRVIGGDKKKKKADRDRSGLGTANPLLQNKPVFVSKRGGAKGKACHDGRPPLPGFVLALRPASTPPNYPLPEIPSDWKPPVSGGRNADAGPSTYQTTTDLAKTSTHDPSSRGSLLGEDKLAGKSVFSYITPSARDRLANLTHNTHLPAAGSESSPASASQTHASAPIPDLDPAIARAALGRGVAGFVPYADDPAKLSRYRAYLSFQAGIAHAPPACPTGMSASDWAQELSEFAHAATIFRPMTGMMASRFASSASSTSQQKHQSDPSSKDSPPAAIPTDPAREAARLGMFGALTRSTAPFYPTRLLCKRFGVPAPSHAAEEDTARFTSSSSAGAGSGSDPSSAATAANTSKFASAGFQVDPTDRQLRQDVHVGEMPRKKRDVSLLGDQRMQDLLRDAGYAKEADDMETLGAVEVPPEKKVDPERNEALEQERAGEELFRRVFGSESESEDED